MLNENELKLQVNEGHILELKCVCGGESKYVSSGLWLFQVFQFPKEEWMKLLHEDCSFEII